MTWYSGLDPQFLDSKLLFPNFFNIILLHATMLLIFKFKSSVRLQSFYKRFIDYVFCYKPQSFCHKNVPQISTPKILTRARRTIRATDNNLVHVLSLVLTIISKPKLIHIIVSLQSLIFCSLWNLLAGLLDKFYKRQV